jgi:hypothetical protein
MPTTVGFRTKTGKAIAIALASGRTPSFVKRWVIETWDPAIPLTGQPHHQWLESPWPEALERARPYEERIFDVATSRLQAILQELPDVHSIAVVGSPDRNIEKIGNRHMRAHAAEGILFRRCIEVAAERCGVRCRTFSDRGFDEKPANLENVMREIGAAAGRPWRIDEKLAATAAWIVLPRRRS